MAPILVIISLFVALLVVLCTFTTLWSRRLYYLRVQSELFLSRGVISSSRSNQLEVTHLQAHFISLKQQKSFP